MKASEYIKKYGLVCANIKIAEIEHSKDFDGFYFDLKRLIESHELIALFDDIDCAKAWVSDLDSDWPYQVKGVDTKFFKWQLEQAIADVENCK